MTRCRLPPDPFETPGSWRTISCRMLQLNGFHPDFLSIKHHCQTLLFRRRKKNPRAASFVRTWQGWLEICTWVSTKTCCLDRIEYLKKKQSTLYIYISYAYISVSYVYTGSRAGSYVYIYMIDPLPQSPLTPSVFPVTHGVSKLLPQILPELSIRIH